MTKPYNTQRNLRSSNKGLLIEGKTRLKTYGNRAFSIYAPKIWNKLPQHIHNIESVATFKTSLKTYLFKQAYSHV